MEEKKKETKENNYKHGVGRRKTSVAIARVFDTKEKTNQITVNLKTANDYFSSYETKEIVFSPFKLTGDKKFKISIKVKGGGIRGQAEATRLAIARALIKINPDLKKEFKDLGYLTRDSREVERKKPGLKKARRAPQFSKR
jgi:small subunit ribosomal protein S9